MLWLLTCLILFALNHRKACLFSAFPSRIVSKIPIRITHVTRLLTRLFSLTVPREFTYSQDCYLQLSRPCVPGSTTSPSFCLTVISLSSSCYRPWTNYDWSWNALTSYYPELFYTSKFWGYPPQAHGKCFLILMIGSFRGTSHTRFVEQLNWIWLFPECDRPLIWKHA